MNKQALISIIIPVYNVEAYLDDCIKSVISQSYKNLEILLIDDGSTDRSGKKCDEWKKQDSRIRVVHKKNGGLSDARNVGLQQAAGAYIGFVDSDDLIHRDMYQILYQALEEYGCPISCCGIEQKTFTKDFFQSGQLERNVRIYSAQEALSAIIKGEAIEVVAWNKLYKKELIEGIFFEKGRYHEDEFWCHQVLGKAGSIAEVRTALYGYRQREASIMHEVYSLRRLDLLDARAEKLLYFQTQFPELIALGRTDLRFECIRAMQFSLLYLQEEELKKAKEKIFGMVKAYPITSADYCMLPFGRQVWCWASNLSFMGTCVLRNWLHKI